MPLEINGVEVGTVHLDGVEVDELYLNGVNVFTAFTGNNFLVGMGTDEHDFFTGLATSKSGGDFFTVGAMRDVNGDEEAVAVKWNSLGEVVWSRKFSNPSMSAVESRFWSCSLLGDFLYCGGRVTVSGSSCFLLVIINTLTGGITRTYRGNTGYDSEINLIKCVEMSSYGDHIYVFGRIGGLLLSSYSTTPNSTNIVSNLRSSPNMTKVSDAMENLYTNNSVMLAHTTIVGKYRAGSRTQSRQSTSSYFVNYWNSTTLNTYNGNGVGIVGIHTASGTGTSVHYFTLIASISKPESVGVAMYKMNRNSQNIGYDWVKFVGPSDQPLIPRKVFDNGDSTFYMVGVWGNDDGFVAKFNSVTMELIYAYNMDSATFWDVNKLSDGRLVFVGTVDLRGIDPGYGSKEAAAFIIDETEHDGTSPITSIGGSGIVTLTPLTLDRSVVSENPNQGTSGYSSSKSSLPGGYGTIGPSTSEVPSGAVTKTLF